MAITLVTVPERLSAALRPVEITFTSDRDDALTGTVTAVASDSGFASYTITGHTYKVGDVVTGSGMSVSGYNGRQTVTAAPVNTITTDKAYSATATGTMTRTNDDFKVLVTCAIGGDTIPGTFYAYADSNGTFRVDFSKRLRAYLTHKVYPLLSTAMINGTVECDYFNFTLTEYWNNASNVLTITPTVADRNKTNATDFYFILASRSHTETSGINTDFSLGGLTKKFLTNAPRATDKNSLLSIPTIASGDSNFLSFFYDDTSNIKCTFKVVDEAYVLSAGVSGVTHSSGEITATANTTLYATFPVNSTLITFTSGAYIACQILKSAVVKSEVFYFKIIETTNEVKYMPVTFLNSFGAWDCFPFYYDYEETAESEKRDYEKQINGGWALSDRGVTTYYAKQQRRFKIKSKLVTKEVASYLYELERSKEVYLNGFTPLSKVKVTIPNILQNNSLIQITLEANYPDTN